MGDMPAKIWARDLDGTGSMHPCAKGDLGAIEFVPADLVEPLVEALRVLTRFCDEATTYEATHAHEYSPYISARAALQAYEAAILRARQTEATND